MGSGFYPFNPTLGQVMQTDVDNVTCDAAYAAHLHWSAAQAIVADVDGVLAAFATAADATTVKATGFTALGCAKNITATAGGVAADVKAVQVIVEGFDIAGTAITETLPAFTVDTLGTVAGSKAFASVTKVTVPAMDGAGVTVSIGFGEKLGLPYKLSANTLLMSFENGTKEAVASTVTVDAVNISGNTIDINTALQGRAVDAYFIV